MEKSKQKKRFVVGGKKKRARKAASPDALLARLTKAERESSLLLKDLLKLKRKINAAKSRSAVCASVTAKSKVQTKPKGKGKAKANGKRKEEGRIENKLEENKREISVAANDEGLADKAAAAGSARENDALGTSAAAKAKDLETADSLIKKHRKAERVKKCTPVYLPECAREGH